MHDGNDDLGTSGQPSGQDTTPTRPQQGGEAGTTRFGMEDGDNTDVPATGLDPEQQGNAARADVPHTSSGYEPGEADQVQVEDEAAKLGDFA
jgi:hypothetical protein